MELPPVTPLPSLPTIVLDVPDAIRSVFGPRAARIRPVFGPRLSRMWGVGARTAKPRPPVGRNARRSVLKVYSLFQNSSHAVNLVPLPVTVNNVLPR